MIHLKLKRKIENDIHTLGVMDIFRDGVFICSLCTIERPWVNNEKSKSSVFAGDYVVMPHTTLKHPETFILVGTKDRTGILIHIVNYVKDLEGCIGVGLVHSDMNADGQRDLKYSTEAMDILRVILKNQPVILLTIK